MADYQLHADFDRDGRLSATGAEHERRAAQPGAILLPNLDVEARALPAEVPAGVDAPQTLDFQRAARSAADGELLPLLIQPRKGAASARGLLTLTGVLAGQVRVYDDRGQRVPRDPAAADLDRFALALDGKPLPLRLEATTLAGSPLTHPVTLSLDPVARRIDEGLLQLTLRTVGGGGALVLEDQGTVTVAPLILMHNLLPAERLYACRIPDRDVAGNDPSLQDVDAALRAAGLPPSVKIPVDVSRGDAWVQDQFQVGYCRAPAGVLRVAWHLPRLRSDIIQSEAVAANLASFVRSHLPSRDLGLFEDFWRRTFPVEVSGGPAQPVAFAQSARLYLAMLGVFALRRWLVFLLAEHTEPPATVPPPTDFVGARRDVDGLATRVTAALDAAAGRAGADRAAVLRGLLRTLRTRLGEVRAAVKLEGDEITLGADPLHLTVTADVANDLFDRLSTALDSVNYGGNLVASPPLRGAPQGKLVVGSFVPTDADPEALRGRQRPMDPDLLRFLVTQAVQPLVPLNTSWLDVGHVDEVMTFVPRGGPGEFAILQSSPGVAVALLAEARRRFRAGLPLGHAEEGTSGPSASPFTRDGTSPVTRLLRGKLWLHHHLPRAVEVLEPPRLYQRMAFRLFQGRRFEPGPSERDRQYPADVNVVDLLFFDRESNALIQSTFLAPVRAALARAFPQVPILELPVLFDAMNDVRTDQTSAFTPNLVNLQVIGNRLLMPRPYGPRMLPADAIGAVKRVLAAQAGDVAKRAQALITPKFIRRRGLDRTYHWAISGLLSTFVSDFRDGFPKGLGDDEIGKRIVEANRPHFDRLGNLRRGRWRRLLIPEGTIDLFELYTEALVAGLGLTIEWIDSWYYHLRLGEIHCGTNVLRRPPQGAESRWWRSQSRAGG
jgi:hypothetical protein